MYWEKERAFILCLMEHGPAPGRSIWRREELHERQSAGGHECSGLFWDAQIWATARLNQISVVFSEDFNPGWITEGVRFVNPFAADFQIETWLSR